MCQALEVPLDYWDLTLWALGKQKIYIFTFTCQILTLGWCRKLKFVFMKDDDLFAGLILGLRPANERRDYKVMPSLIGRVQT